MNQVDHQQLVDVTERWFQGRGLPFASPHGANPLVLFSRTIPLLVLALIAEAIALWFSDDYEGTMLWGVFFLAVIALASLLILIRGGRPRRTWSMPAWVAGIAIVAFVFGPAVIVVGFGGRERLAVALLAVNVVVLLLAMLLEYFNILPIVRHEIDEIRTGQRQMLAPMRQVLPILLLAVLFLFMTAEVWQVAHDATPLGFTIVVVALIGLSAAVVAARSQDALAGAATFTSWEQVHEVAASTKAPDLPLAGDLPEPPDIAEDSVGRSEVKLLLFVTMTVQQCRPPTSLGSMMTPVRSLPCGRGTRSICLNRRHRRS